MWRAFGSLILTFVALGWAIVSIALCFFYLASLWSDVFGRVWSFYIAVIAFGLSLITARTLLRFADRLLEPYSGPFDSRAYTGAPRETYYHDWWRYAQDIIRNRRYAFYSRTRQLDRLAALDAEIAAAKKQSPPADPPARRGPQRTSMAHAATFEERRRATRRHAGTATVQTPAPRWEEMDE